MNEKLLKEILDQLKNKTILVVGDYFLDKYLLIDPAKDEPSLETGLTAYQVVGKRLSPGAAGTVTNNLTALGVGNVIALGIIGDDGEGYDLIKGLKATGVNTDHLVKTNARVTPTYTKPLVAENGNEREINRLDIKNWSSTPDYLEDQIIDKLYYLAERVDAIIALDQVVEENYGVITERVRETLAYLGRTKKDLIIYSDSRAYTRKFKDIIVKCNNYEAVQAVMPDFEGEPDFETIKSCGKKFMENTGRPVFVTMGKRGQMVFNGESSEHVAAVPVEGPVDICGAGDATTSGIVSALCCKADFPDAALFGNIVASITIQQIGTTGTASPKQILDRYKEMECILCQK